ncbi:hypothetical protein [Formosa sp. Hel1_31_208]|nr:hypothetical protein [Formosa sp. Hel1_31_208]
MNYLLKGEAAQRLQFRLFTKDDFDAWLPLFAQPNVGLFLGMPEGIS